MTDLKRRSVAEILAGLDDVKMSKTARAAVEEALLAAYREGQASCTPDALRDTVAHSVAYAGRAGYLEALRDVADEQQRAMGEAHTAASRAYHEAFREMVRAPVEALAIEGIEAAGRGIDAVRAELSAAAEAAPDRARWVGTQPLTGLRELARRQAAEESAVTVTVTTEDEETPR